MKHRSEAHVQTVMTNADSISRRSRRGVDSVLLNRHGLVEASITVHMDGETGLRELLEEARDEVAALGLTVLRQNVFGTSARHGAAPMILREIFGHVDWPVTWMEEGDSLGERLTGTRLYAVGGADVRRLRQSDQVVASVFADPYAEYCHVGGVVGLDLTADRQVQTRQVFERMEDVLGLGGMAFRHLVRTWFYNDRILEWYSGFNSVRTQFFRERGTFDGLVPASTGIGGSNYPGAALVADALAIRPHDADTPLVTVQEVASPLQCPATDYRSSFSRAVEIRAPDCRKLLVSGTASIAPSGETVRLDDVPGQVDLTLDVVGAQLRSRQMDWPDVVRAIAYVKRGVYAEAYHERMRARGLPRLPVVVTENDVCRDDLLFELEVDAWQGEAKG